MSVTANFSLMVNFVIGRRGVIPFDALIVVCLVAYVFAFLAIRKVTNISFVILFLLAAFHFFHHRGALKAASAIEGSRLLIVALASLFLAVLLGMLLRGRFDPADLDGPSRYMLAGLLLLFFLDKQIRFVQVFAIFCPVSLILALLAAIVNPEVATKWGGRFATSFVDPNTLGSYAVILSFMTLLTLDALGRDRPWLKFLKYAGIAAGVLLATMAASRGGWVAVPALLALWALFRSRLGSRRLAFNVLFIAGFISLGLLLMPDVATRAAGSVSEIRSSLDGSNTETAAGQRLSIWKLGIALFVERPFFGYGSAGVREQLALPEFATLASPTINTGLIYGGPHNDLLGMLLGSGILGAVSFALILFVPIYFFWRRRGAAEHDVRLACELGICLAAGVFVCGLTNEMLSLKYLASFYGITIAGLAAQVLGATTRPVSQSL